LRIGDPSRAFNLECPKMPIWTIEDHNGQVLPDFACGSRLDVARRVVPVHYDAFRLHVSSSYRELFERAVKQALDRRGWQIVRIGRAGVAARPASPYCLASCALPD
jgi:hypothetical protein